MRKSAQHRERARRRDEGDADDEEVEQAPGIAEEARPEDEYPGRKLDDEDRQHRPIDGVKQRTMRLHRAGARLEPQGDRVEDDEGEDDALGARVFDDAGEHG
jgi:hypothetical protein